MIFQEFIDMFGKDIHEIVFSFKTALMFHNKHKIIELCRDSSYIYHKYSKENVMLSILWHVLRKELNIKWNRVEQPDYGIIENPYLMVGIYSCMVNNKFNEDNIRIKYDEWISIELDKYKNQLNIMSNQSS